MQRIGVDRPERLDIVPAQLRFIHCPAVHGYIHERGPVRLKYVCRACAEGVTQAPAAAHLIGAVYGIGVRSADWGPASGCRPGRPAPRLSPLNEIGRYSSAMMKAA
ncbi:hypothetical protein [Leisingera caerulea]|uniref:hypothetical protein n=1 Tax=Leisingera caerulea TaxID=506591 RepID=UPI00041B14A0